MSVFFFFIVIILHFIFKVSYIRCVKSVHSNVLKKRKDIINNSNKAFLSQNKEKVDLIKNFYSNSKKNLLYLKAPYIFHKSLPEKLKKNCFVLFENSKYIENLKNVKKIDNTILGNFFHGKENELIDEIPEKLLNSFKWALEYRLKNFNCKFMRISKFAKKNNQELKSLDNYAIGYKENLLAMLIKDKNFFINIINKLKSKDYFNFDIYSIFRFINVDIRFLFYPDCNDESAIFFLILGNLDKAIDYFIQNNHMIDFSEFEKNLNGLNRCSINKEIGRECKADAAEIVEKVEHVSEMEETKDVSANADCYIESDETNSNLSDKDDKLNYFIKNYHKMEYFFKNFFNTPDKLKSFFENCHEKEKKIKKKEISFNLNNEKVINTKEVIIDGLNLDMLKSIIKRSPRISLINKNTMLNRISHYKNDLNYSYKELLKILYNLPQFFAFGNLKKKYKELLYLHDNIKEEDLKKLIKKYPRIFTYNVYRTIQPKLLYLIRHLNKNFYDILSFPQYFSYSFRLRIIPRHVAYMNIYYDNYIEYYKQLVKKYSYEDFNKNFNNLVYKSNIPSIDLKMLLQTSNKAFMNYFNISYYDFVKSTQQAKHIHNPYIIV